MLYRLKNSWCPGGSNLTSYRSVVAAGFPISSRVWRRLGCGVSAQEMTWLCRHADVWPRTGWFLSLLSFPNCKTTLWSLESFTALVSRREVTWDNPGPLRLRWLWWCSKGWPLLIAVPSWFIAPSLGAFGGGGILPALPFPQPSYQDSFFSWPLSHRMGGNSCGITGGVFGHCHLDTSFDSKNTLPPAKI